MKKEIIVLGAGPAGISAAFELSKTGKNALVIEKNKEIGGLARTFFHKEFVTDVGPHRFYSKNKKLYELIEGLLGKKWIKVNRMTRFYIKGKYFSYPVNLKNALSNAGLIEAVRMAFDYAKERTKKVFVKKEAVSFEEHIVSEFGRSLAELNMLNYTEKIWGTPCSQISSDWATQRIKGLSITEVLKKSLGKTNTGPKTMVEQFYYPEEGNYLIYEKMKEKAKNAEIKTNSFPEKIFHKNNQIEKVLIQTKKGNQLIEVQELISSIPLTEFISLLEPKPPKEVLNAAKKLRFRSHASLFITLNKKKVFDDQWIYFPDKEIPFGRIMEPKNFSSKLSPKNKTSLLLEFFCWENDKIWKSDPKKLFELSFPFLQKLNFVKKEEVIDFFVHKEKYAYPVYDLEYKKPLEKIMNYLNQFENLQLIGRAGRFQYNNQDHAIESGLNAARNLIEEKKFSLETGKEQEYLEKGYIK